MEDDEDYRPLYCEKLDNCSVCGSSAQLLGVWPRLDQYVVCCSRGASIGKQDPEFLPGCPMYIPKREFHQPTEGEAAGFWNSFMRDLLQIRRQNDS
jgi:hypothetical protein